MNDLKQEFQDLIISLSEKYLVTLHSGGESATLIEKLSSFKVLTVFISLTLDKVPAIKYDGIILIGNNNNEWRKLDPIQEIFADKMQLHDTSNTINEVEAFINKCKNQ